VSFEGAVCVRAGRPRLARRAYCRNLTFTQDLRHFLEILDVQWSWPLNLLKLLYIVILLLPSSKLSESSVLSLITETLADRIIMHCYICYDDDRRCLVVFAGTLCSRCWRSSLRSASWRRARRENLASLVATSVRPSHSTRIYASSPIRLSHDTAIISVTVSSKKYVGHCRPIVDISCGPP